MSQRVLVVPENGLYLAFRLLPILVRAGYLVDLLCMRGNPVASSRYVEKRIAVSSDEELYERLIGIIGENCGHWHQVIVADEVVLRELIRRVDSAVLAAWQPGMREPDIRAFCESKGGLELAARDWGLSIPPSRVCADWEEITTFGEAVGWPVIAKLLRQSGGTGVRIFESPSSFSADDAEISFPVLAQKFITGKRGVVDMVCSKGRALGWLSSYTTKAVRSAYGPSTARCFQHFSGLAPLVDKVAHFTRFEGFCGFDWIEEVGSGRFFLVEFHPRPSSGFRFGADCGVDFSAAVRSWLAGSEIAIPLVQARGSVVHAHYFTGDLLRCIRERDWNGLKAWLPGNKVCHDIFWDDIPLFVSWVISRFSR